MDDLTLILTLVGAALVLVDLVIPSGGLLSGAGIALLIERGLAALGVAVGWRWGLAAGGMVITVSLAVRYGERVTERLFPARIQTNVDRLVGSRCVVKRVEPQPIMIELEGDLWSARLAEDSPSPVVGGAARVVALDEQTPVIHCEGPLQA
ncbi:MAG: NfeD family protein [Bradymonadia bacterium]